MTLESCGCPDRPMTWCSGCVAQQDRTIQGLAKHVMEQRRQLGVMALVNVGHLYKQLIQERAYLDLLNAVMDTVPPMMAKLIPEKP